ncbi:MAG TPA: zinc ribbon domain-containing protein [Thermoanaerobaculia bacterium]
MERYCSNCRAELPDKATNCPECGVYAGDLFDGKFKREKRPVSAGLLALLFLAMIGAGYAVWMNRFRKEPEVPKPDAPPTRVVKDRPGRVQRGRNAKVTEAEAIRILIAHLVETRGLKKECVVVMSNGYRDDTYRLTAFNHCEQTRLGKWQVTGRTGEVKQKTAG